MPLCVKGVGWSGCGQGRRVVARPGSGFPEEPVFWGVIRSRWLQSRSPTALPGP
jgi:hypothetical protein